MLESSKPDISVIPASESERDQRFCKTVVETLSELGFVTVEPNSADRYLVCGREDGLSLREPGRNGVERISSRTAAPRQVSRRDPLGRAVGRGNTRVLDATAGLGNDMLLMLLMGFHVTGIEQSPLLYVMLKDRLDQTLDDAQKARMRLYCGDSNTKISTIVPTPEVIYLDPMFPPRRKTSALPKKELMELRLLAARPETGASLLHSARRIASNRVIVKRLPESEPISNEPDWSLEGKTVRYDVYASISV